MRKYLVLFAVALIVASLPAMAARLTTIPIQHEPLIVYQAYPGDSCVRPIKVPGDGDEPPAITVCFRTQAMFKGNNGLDGDPITSVPGILQIIPGDNWSNYVTIQDPATQTGYAIKSVRLRKIIPEFLQCSWIYNGLPDVLQRGTDNIRLWWPLMYEAPGTRWILEIAWIVPGQLVLYNETWTWDLHADLVHLQHLMELLHELPWGTCEVPLISDSFLYWHMRSIVDGIASAWPNDPIRALDWVLDLENLIIDNCISVCPPSPMPYDELGRLGITNTDENPACCKLLIDVEYIAFDMGIFTPAN